MAVRYRRTSAGPGVSGERWWNWAVAARAEPHAPFGTVELSLADEGATAQIGYLFAPAAWGRGLACESCGAALAYLGERARTRSVDAHADTRNAHSIRLLERLGFARIETLANADDFKGSPSDEHVYRRTLALEKDDDAQAPRR